MEATSQAFVAVHCGAGFHAPRLSSKYLTVMKSACLAAKQSLQTGRNCSEAVAAAVAILEDDPVTNAGMGSNLTEEGTVECDASLMSSDGCFGAVGACPGVKNPIFVALKLAEESKTPMPLHRVRPIFLAGDGARAWALKRGLCVAESSTEASKWNITETSQRQWQHYSNLIAEALPAQSMDPPTMSKKRKLNVGLGSDNKAGQAEQQTCKKPAPGSQRHQTDVAYRRSEQFSRKAEKASDQSEDLTVEGSDLEAPRLLYDTVGCIIVNDQGNCAAAVSSGGIAVKSSGRIGEAAVFGSGCWASEGTDGTSVACSITGVGESIMRARLAQAVCQDLTASSLLPSQECSETCANAIQTRILEALPPGPPLPPDCGIIAVSSRKLNNELLVNFGVAHSSASMAFAYWNSGIREPSCIIDRQAASGSISRFGLQARCPILSHNRNEPL